MRNYKKYYPDFCTVHRVYGEDSCKTFGHMYLGHSNFLNVQGHVHVCSGIRLGNSQGTLMSRIAYIPVTEQKNVDTAHAVGTSMGKNSDPPTTHLQAPVTKQNHNRSRAIDTIAATKPPKVKWMRRIRFLKCSLSNKGMARLVIQKKPCNTTATCALKFHQD